MKQRVTRFNNLRSCLKELEPFIRNGEHLQTGRPFNRIGLRSREILANWLLCVVANTTIDPDRLWFSSDPLGGDGIIHDRVTGETWATEHVLVPKARRGAPEQVGALILEAIDKKRSKGGAAYAAGKTLVVFLNAGGAWLPNAVAEQQPNPLHFEAVWVVSLRGVEADEYVYNVTRLDLSRGNAPTWCVRIGENFDTWKIMAVQ
jgi:hypothetical protein